MEPTFVALAIGLALGIPLGWMLNSWTVWLARDIVDNER